MSKKNLDPVIGSLVTGPAELQFLIESVEGGVLVQSHLQSVKQEHNLLYVEDNPATLKLVTMIIARRPDLRLLSAETGYLGLELARENRPEVILMDINLPDISGIEVMRILSEDPATAHIPVVGISAYEMTHDNKKGFFRFLAKPIKIDEFMDTLDTALVFAENWVGA